MSIYVVAIITPAPGKEELVKSLLADFANTVKTNEPNAVRYLVLEQYDGHEGELCKLVVQETYHTQEAFDEHFKTEHFAALGKLIGEGGLLARPLDIKKPRKHEIGISAPLLVSESNRTADEYADSEDLIGKWIAANPSKRKKIFLATKCGMISAPADAIDKRMIIDSSPEYCREALEKSLKRLGLPYVDLYYIHRLDEITPVEKTIEALVELKEAGKIKHIGRVQRLCLAIEDPDIRLLEAARELGVAVVAYSPMGNGLLTGGLRKVEDFTKEGDLRASIPWLNAENLENNVAIVDQISEIAKKKGITTAQLALVWVLAQDDDIFAIPGTTKIHRLAESLGSMSISLSSEEEKAVRELAKGVMGGRVQKLMGHTFADTPQLEKV